MKYKRFMVTANKEGTITQNILVEGEKGEQTMAWLGEGISMICMQGGGNDYARRGKPWPWGGHRPRLPPTPPKDLTYAECTAQPCTMHPTQRTSATKIVY